MPPPQSSIPQICISLPAFVDECIAQFWASTMDVSGTDESKLGPYYLNVCGLPNAYAGGCPSP